MSAAMYNNYKKHTYFGYKEKYFDQYLFKEYYNYYINTLLT